MSAIKISIFPAFPRRQGRVPVKKLGEPAIIERIVYTNKVMDVERELNRLCEYAETLPGAWSATIKCVDGRKPPGFDDFFDAHRREGDGAKNDDAAAFQI